MIQSMLEIRKLTQDEREASYRLSQYSFGFWSDNELSEQDLSRIEPDIILAGFVENKLVAKITNWPFQQCVRGIMKPSGGLAGVGTDPLHRRKGYIRQLMLATFEAMRDQGLVVSSLYPFLESFYAKFDYVTSNDYLWLKFPTQNLAHYLPFSDHSEEWELVKLPAKEAQEPFFDYMAEIAPKYHGFVLQTDVSEYVWQNYMAKDQFVLLVKQHGRTVGLARYKISGNMHGGELTLNNIYWQSTAARDRLFGFFALHIVNFPTTAMAVPMGVNFQNWFQDPSTPYEVSIDYLTMMCRVIDPIGAVEKLPAPVNGRFTFQYADEHCPWVDGTYEMVGENARLFMHRIAKSAESRLSVKGLSALVFGTHSVADVLHKDWAEGISTTEQSSLNQWFPSMLAFNPNKF